MPPLDACAAARRALRALALALALAMSLGACGGDGTGPVVPASVRIAPIAPGVTVGDTVRLTAEVRDTRGNPMAGQALTWATSTPQLVALDGPLVTALAPGYARITATAGDVTGAFAIEVGAPRVAWMRVQPAFADVLVGDSVLVTLTMFDAHGRVVTGRTPGVNVPSTDHMRYDASGWVHFRAGGTFGFTFWADQATATVQVRVRERPLATLRPVRRRLRLEPGARGFPHMIGGTTDGRELSTPPQTIVSLDPSIVRITGMREYEAVAPGATELLATFDGIEARIPIAVDARPASALDVDVRWAVPQHPGVAASIEGGVARWRRVIVGDLPDVRLSLPAGACAPGTPAFDEAVDDLVVWMVVAPIDGAGGVLGEAGPCVVRGGGLPLAGVITLDAADLGSATGRTAWVEQLIAHELGHVLGIGTLWDESHVSGAADPRYTAPRARLAAGDIGFLDQETTGVAVEAGGGEGTAGAHWRESVFRHELMTGWLEDVQPPLLSAITVGALLDLGYGVHEGGADPLAPPLPLPYPTFGPGLRIERAPGRSRPIHERLRRPRFLVGADGTVRAIAR